MWLGTRGSLEEAIVARRGLPFKSVPSGPVVGTNPLQLAWNALRIAAGIAVAWRAMRVGRRVADAGSPARPDVVFVTGGYVCVPVAIAAKLRRIPLAVYLPDVKPGKAVDFIARLADKIAVTAESAVPYLPAGKAVVTGYPVRPAIRTLERGVARRRLGLNLTAPVLLVFGGSQGARRLNRAVAGAAERLLAHLEIVHVAGQKEYERAKALWATLPVRLATRYHLYEYLHDEDMTAGLAAADLVVSRAGAATLGEFPARGLPAILVPLPISGGHQIPNARVLTDAGAALFVEDGLLDADRLVADVNRLLGDPDKMDRMRQAARGLDAPEAADKIGALLVELASAGTPGAAGATGAAGITGATGTSRTSGTSETSGTSGTSETPETSETSESTGTHGRTPAKSKEKEAAQWYWPYRKS